MGLWRGWKQKERTWLLGGNAKRAADSTVDGAELARRLLCVCHTAISLWEVGWCLGAPLPAEIKIAGHAVVHSGAGQSAYRLRLVQRRYALHMRREHSAGCRGLGVSRQVLRALIRDWDRDGATELLLEAFDEAMAEAEHAEEVGSWTALGAHETIEHAVRTRITPAGQCVTNEAGPALQW